MVVLPIVDDESCDFLCMDAMWLAICRDSIEAEAHG